MFETFRFLSLILLFAVAALVHGEEFQCGSKGRYTKMSGGTRHYCWDGTHFPGNQAPDAVKEHFGHTVTPVEKKDDEKAGDEEAEAAEAPPPPKPAVTAEAVRVPRSTKPEAVPVRQDKVGSIAVGADGDTVIRTLGEPHGMLSNLGEDGQTEVWTYLLIGGGAAKLRLVRGKVISVELPELNPLFYPTGE